MPSKKFKTEYGSIPCKSGEDDDNNEDEEAVPVPVFKIFIKAHFQKKNELIQLDHHTTEHSKNCLV